MSVPDSRNDVEARPLPERRRVVVTIDVPSTSAGLIALFLTWAMLKAPLVSASISWSWDGEDASG